MSLLSPIERTGRKLLEKFIYRYGYRMYRINGRRRDMHEDSFWEAYEHDRQFTMTPVERMYSLFKCVEYLESREVPGAYVECGSWKGGSCMMMAHAVLIHGKTPRDIWLYDTFDWPIDPKAYKENWGDTSFMKAGEERQAELIQEVRSNMLSTGYDNEHLFFVAGPTETTLQEKLPEQIALLRLDTHPYESVVSQMEYLYPRLVPHGVLILDNCLNPRFMKAINEAIEKFPKPVLLVRIDDECQLLIKPDD